MPKPRKHKRKGPKNTRAGCLCCKPWKMNGAKRKRRMQRRWERQARVDEAEQRRAA